MNNAHGKAAPHTNPHIQHEKSVRTARCRRGVAIFKSRKVRTQDPRIIKGFFSRDTGAMFESARCAKSPSRNVSCKALTCLR